MYLRTVLGSHAPRSGVTGMKLRRRFALVVALAVALLAPRRARADAVPFGPVFAVAGAIALAAVVVDTAFTIHDATEASDKSAPAKGWAVPEVIVVAPQAFLLNVGL